MQAGLVAVPLPLSHRGSGHDRLSAVLGDTSPTVVPHDVCGSETWPGISIEQRWMLFEDRRIDSIIWSRGWSRLSGS